MSLGETGKKLGEMWNRLGESDKQLWSKKALELTKIRNDKIASGEIIPKVSKRTKKVGSGKKRPTTPYIMFVIEQRPQVVSANPKIANTEVIRKLGQMWGSLSESAKKVYKDKALLRDKQAA
eukprot:CAMPEP_0201523592 /NCGR_PEP_ID=MMETSP0161_2-20130828/20431_1 /ASSEMBLY_ACC=CAM_ASM_000251 /TAXON_ID=180227 /ORGANISM="Neoparamoeba aestuarina, Strain SoJaBio B1-5/56/2" /LENGTH=121 /DNA_ID=CAMNT_0047922761 /DNA_START=124 /DNA_END=489 /DNA_ORIENTATION=+